jgi:integrase
MAASVYKICCCRDQVKCRHPWWFSFTRRGARQLRKSLDVVLEKHIDSKTEAECEAGRLRAAMREILDDPTSKALNAHLRKVLDLPPLPASAVLEALTMGQMLGMYQERHLDKTATGERRAYEIGAITRTQVTRPDGVVAALGEWLVTDVSVDTLERLREARVIRGLNVQLGKRSNRVGGEVAANRDLRMLRAAFNWAIRMGLVDRTPFKRAGVSAVKLTKERQRSRRLQPGEEQAILAACDASQNSHLRSIVEAALETGCRKGELLGLQWSKVQLAGRPEIWLSADKTKTGKARRVPISTRLKPVLEMRRDALRAVLELKEDEPLPETLYVFGNEIGQRAGAIKTAWRLACERAKVNDLHFHDLRREAGSRWMEAGVPLATIQKWLGHTNIAQTSTYLATTTAGEHEAMRRYEERIGRLIPVDTEGATPPLSPAQSDTTSDEQTQQNSTKH